MVNFRVDYKKMMILSLLLILTSVTVSGSFWLFASLAEKNISQTRNIEINNLEGQLTQLREAVRAKEIFKGNNQALGSEVTATN